MSTGLLSQLDAYFSDVDADQGPASPDEVAAFIEGVGDVPAVRTPVRTRSRVWVGVAAFALILALVGGVALLAPFGGSGTDPSDEPTATTVAETEIRTDATVPITPVIPVWTKIDGPEGATRSGLLITGVDGFVYIGDGGWFATSRDGITWERTELSGRLTYLDSAGYWDGNLMGWAGGGFWGAEGQPIVANPSFVEVSQPNGSVSSFSIDGGITAAGIGGTGTLVLSVDNTLDHMVILGLMPGEEEQLRSTRIEGGVLSGTFADGTSRSVVLAELGIDPEDIHKAYGWFSEDGTVWAPVAGEPPREIHQMIGSDDGFYAMSHGGPSSGLWFTENGDDWSRLGSVEADGVFARSGEDIIWVRSDGFQMLAPQGMRTGASWDEIPPDFMPSVVGEHGVLSFQSKEGPQEETVVQASYSAFGEPFVQTEVPDEMARSNGWGMWTPSAAVVGDRYLLMLFTDDFEPSFWIRDFAGN
jgi:hypothetical protein